MINNERDVINLVQEDEWMMDILRSAKQLNLPDWWICAGFVRSKIWDTLHSFNPRTTLPDIDVIYYDQDHLDEHTEKLFENQLKTILPDIPWSVKNEARMSVINNLSPYLSSVDAISKFPETATALGLKLDAHDKVILVAPYGIYDVVNLEVRPTPYFLNSKEHLQIYEQRIMKKNWPSIWSQVKIYPIDQFQSSSQ